MSFMCVLLYGNRHFVFGTAQADGDTLQVGQHCAIVSVQPPLLSRRQLRRNLKRLEVV